MNILLILEGKEEEMLFNIIKNYIDSKFHVDIINAGGCGSVPAYFQSKMSDPYYDVVLCVYDVDKRADVKNSAYSSIRNKLYLILGSEKSVDEISFCTNPNVMQLVLLAADKFHNVKMASTSKKENSSLYHKYWPEIGNNKDYDAKDWQLEKIFDSFKYGEYKIEDMLSNAEDMPTEYKDENGSNLPLLIKALLTGNYKFFNSSKKIKETNKK